MMKNLGVAFAFVVLGATSAMAQTPAAPATPDISEKLIGTWEGPYQSDAAPPGGIRMIVAKENGGWKVSLAVISDQELPGSEITDFKVEGGVVSWSQGIAGLDCKSQATIENGVLKGGTECGGGGQVITATFLLQKK